MTQDTDLTIFFDDGRAPHFERGLDREPAEARVRELRQQGILSANILEDLPDD